LNREAENEADESEEDDENNLFCVRSRIEGLIANQQSRAIENEQNLNELKMVLENMNYHFIEPEEQIEVSDADKYIGQVQDGQERLEAATDALVKGAAELFVRRNRAKLEDIRSQISDLVCLTSQIDEEIRVKNELLEEKLNSNARIDATNQILRRRIESTKNEIRAIAGQDFEDIPELARTYQETMKRILGEEVELSKQKWAAQEQLEREKKDQVQMSLMYQKIKEHPLRMAQLQEELESKLAVLRTELFEKEKMASRERGQVALSYQNETQRLIIQARKDREEKLFNLKFTQIQQLLLAEKQSREEKLLILNSANPELASSRQFKVKVQQLDRESKTLVSSYEQAIRKAKQEFQESERKMRRDHDVRIQAAQEEAQSERRDLEAEVQLLERTLSAKNIHYEESSQKLRSLQSELADLKERIARFDVSYQQVEKATAGNSMAADGVLELIVENRDRKIEEKNMVKKRMFDVLMSLSYFRVLVGEAQGDWIAEARTCYELALKECEFDVENLENLPVPFSRGETNACEAEPVKKVRRLSFS
jgi:hypothetical protein